MLSLHKININPLFNAQLMVGEGGRSLSEVAQQRRRKLEMGGRHIGEAGSKLESVMRCGFPRA
jgi:hypothetical protein